MLRKILLFLFLLSGIQLNAQDVLSGIHQTNSLNVGFGFSFGKVKDKRISNRSFGNWAPKFTLGYVQANDRRISQIELQFSNYKERGNPLLNLNFIMSGIYYSYQRKVQDYVWIGGFFDHNTLLNFPRATTWLFNNNPVSYTLAQSIGPKISYGRHFDGSLESGISAQTALLAYVVRPIFGHPYPSKFMDEKVFNPQLSGLAGPLLRSGKIKTLNAFRNLRLKFGLTYHLSNSIGLSLNYDVDMLYTNASGKSSSFSAQDLLLRVSYKH